MFTKKAGPERAGRRHDVLFYTKEGCHLCDEAEEILHNLQQKCHLSIREIDITEDREAFERYKNIIPVVIVAGTYTFGARVSRDDILACIGELEASENLQE